MANLAETPTWETGIYRWETTDPVQGGEGGIDNVPTLQLANRTAYLKRQTDKLNMFIGLGGSLTWTIQELEKTINLDTLWFGNTVTINHTNASYAAAKLILSVDGLTSLDRGYKIWIKKGTLSTLGLSVQVVNATAGGGVLAEMDPFTPNGYVYEFIFNGTAWKFNQNINEDLAGTVHAFGYGFPPAGFLACNGAAVSRTAYARLFSRIGTTFGSGDGSTTFNIPDLRGEFIRGWDNGRGVDAGRVLGSAQGESVNTAGVQLRESSTTWAATGAGVGSSVAYFENSNITAYGTNMSLLGGTETRPRNIALLMCIKY